MVLYDGAAVAGQMDGDGQRRAHRTRGGRAARAWRCAGLALAGTYRVSAVSTSAYHTQLSPRDSSATRSRVRMSMRVECMPSSCQEQRRDIRWRCALRRRRSTGEPLLPRCVLRVGQEIALLLEAHAIGRSHRGAARHGQVMDGVVEPQRKADDRQAHPRPSRSRWRGPGAPLRTPAARHLRGRRSRSISIAATSTVPRTVGGLAPQPQPIAVQRYREDGVARQVARVGVQLDLDAIRKVAARHVGEDMAVGHQEQARPAAEEEATGTGQAPGTRARY